MKRQVIFYGAFDRYNYGDNLMPILLKKYFEKYHENVIKDIDFVFSSIKKSDLSVYKCIPTIPMRELLRAPENSTIIVVGGEVLGATAGILFTHVQDKESLRKVVLLIKKISPRLLNRIAKIFYKPVWNYPYVVDKNSFKNRVNIVYNTVGGKPDKTQFDVIRQADYISSRDDRTYSYLKDCVSSCLVPDSVLMASGVLEPGFLISNVRPEIRDLVSDNYISVQACPYKVGFTDAQLANEIDNFTAMGNAKVILLPIGYASGHDDALFLRNVKSLCKSEVLLLDELNVWEIMFIISKSQAFFGTSLHGVITAMSFGVAHFSLNSKIEKLTSFLNTWSVYPFNQPIDNADLSSAVVKVQCEHLESLKSSVANAQNIIFKSLKDISAIL
ncbi:polysaccharide pyruvyl transferase family protein [Raoultella sp. RIT712]|uniref:polysaccharide pyruvyl transferase family protein n=1 Tax=Raoultella sp. RIT712 TaxID=2666191 RepID=UPI0012AE8F03|nr:polysaccharide pyruvyl transferase family protein [Raoultella sp. RIT712]MRT49950.1 polysaccharide pyruvyl transferase family protein [Raoultella sp. RIT712]